jgi:TPR repeat protein
MSATAVPSGRYLAIAFCVSVLVALPHSSRADDLDDGLAAYNRADFAVSLRLLMPLAVGGNAVAQAEIGRIYLTGQGVTQDYLEATKWFRLSAAQRNPQAQEYLGDIYYGGLGVPRDYSAAAKWYELSAQQGDGTSQAELGEQYLSGTGVTNDYPKALVWLQKSADQGNQYGEAGLGDLYVAGHGVEKNLSEAFKWYMLSANQGNTNSQGSIGAMYYFGFGTVQSYPDAFRWYKLAADSGEHGSQNMIGNMYYSGQSVDKNLASAYYWFKKSADQGDSEAQASLGAMYLMGEYVNKDIDEAVTWLALASKQGNKDADKLLAIVRSSNQNSGLSGNGISEVQLESDGGTLVVPVSINNTITLKFTIDSGSADVSVPADVVLTLVRSGTIQTDDFLGQKTYVLADGSTVPSQTFRIRSLKIGDREIDNVTASIADIKGTLLLGQSFLSRFTSWSIDNQRQVLILK